MSRRDRMLRAQEAKERVKSGVYNSPSTTGTTRRDRLRADVVDTASVSENGITPPDLSKINVMESKQNFIDNVVQSNAKNTQTYNPVSTKLMDKRVDKILTAKQKRDAQDPNNPILKFIKDNTVDRLGNLLDPIANSGVASQLSQGANIALPGALAKDATIKSTGSKIADAGLKGVGMLAGGAMLTGAPNPLMNQSIINTANTGTTAARIGKGIGIGAGLGATQPLLSGDDNLKNMALSATVGGVTGGLGEALAPAISKAFTNTKLGKMFAQHKATETPVQAMEPQGNTLGLPAPKQRGNVNTAVTPDVIQPYGESAIFELPAPKIADPTKARTGPKVNVYEQKLSRLFSEANKMDLPPGREREYMDDLWSRMADRNDPSLDELIDLAYPSQKKLNPNLGAVAREQQRQREVYGVPNKVKSLNDRMAPQGQLGIPAEPVERVGYTGPKAVSPKTEVLPINSQLPSRPRINVTPEKEVEEILQSTSQPRVRDRVYNLLDEAEKAARERIKARRGRLSSTPVDEYADYAIIGAAKMGKGTIKAADWTEEMVKEFGESFRPMAQQVYRQSKEQLQRKERLATKEADEAKIFNDGPGDVNSFAKKIGYNAKKVKVPFSKRWEKIRTQTIDDLAPLEGVEKRVRGKVASAEDSLYKSARLFKGMPAKANQIVKEQLSPIVDMVEKAGFTADELGHYALARHAKDVNEAGYKSGFTNSEIESMLQHYGTPEMESARKALIKINDDMLQELTDSGVISKELTATLRERWQNYVPLFRELEDDAVNFGGGLSKALANVTSPIKTLQGSEKKVINPLENMVKSIFQSTSAAERNKVAQQVAKLAEEDTTQKFIRKLGSNEEVGRKNVVNVKVNGENVKYEVEPEVYKALLNLDQESSNMLIKTLQAPASLLRSGATLTPEFSLRNPFRDVIQAFVVSKSGFNPVIDFPVGIIQSISKGKLYREWVRNMGDYGGIVSMDRNVHKEALTKVLGESTSKKFVNVISGKSFINLLRAITDTTEAATKVGEYRAALRKGASPQEAAYRSRDIMDFGRAGSSIRQTNKIIAFLNANLQGKSKLIRSIKENPIGVTTRAFTAVTLPTIGIYALNHNYANETQRNTIEEAPDWMKDTFWLVAVPGTDVVARLPKPFDLAIFANLPERALQFIQKNDPEAFDGFVQRTLKSMAVPAQITGLIPFIEGMANYSFFREGDIIPQREQALKFNDQYDPVRTTETAKLLAAGANKLTGGSGSFKNFSSPRIMDNTIKGLTAGLGTYATTAIDSLLQGKVFGQKVFPAVLDRPEAPKKRLEQVPLVKAFLVDSLQSTKSMDKLYTEREKLTTIKNSSKLNGEKFSEKTQLKKMDKSADKLSKINAKIREIESDRSLSGTQKRSLIEPMLIERNRISKETMQGLRK